jgi:hypothetical protein
LSRQRLNKISGQFSARLIEMLESPAYRVLSLAAHRVISRIEVELAHHGGKDNGRLPVTFDDFEEYGIDRHSIGPAINEAEAMGVIRVTERGRHGKANRRSPNYFRLTYRPAKGLPGDGTHEWRKIAAHLEGQDALNAARLIAKISRRKEESPVGKNTLGSGNSPLQKGGKRGKTPLPRSVKTPTTIYISGEDAAKPARDARPPTGAVASGQAASKQKSFDVASLPSAAAERPEVVQSRLAGRLCAGPDGWVMLQRLGDADPAQLERLTISESRGELTDADLEVVRASYRRAVA